MEQKWLLCDMHTHSEYSKFSKPGDRKRVKAMTAAEFLKTLTDNGVELFSVTDHNFFSNVFYDDLEKEINKNYPNVNLLPGAELDVHVDGNLTKFFHACFYFEKNVDKTKLNLTINNLYKDTNGKSLSPTLNEILNKLFELGVKFIMIPHGDKDRGTFDMVRRTKILDEVDFYKYAMYKVFNAFEVKPDFYSTDIRHWSANFFKQTESYSNIIEKLTEEQIKSIEINITKKIRNESVKLTSEENEIYSYCKTYGNYFAYFSFSDWHNAEEYFNKINNFIFGDVRKPFESFELATLDPLSRIQHSTSKVITIPDSIIEKLHFNLNGSNVDINFSPGLNAIVGKRGSGKSLLVSILKSLDKKDDDAAVRNLYKTFAVNNIYCYDRGGIKINEGSLNSIIFLSQNDIKSIFENPSQSETTIAKYFKDISPLDLSELKELYSYLIKLKPLSKEYKSLTNNLKSLKTLESFSLKDLETDVDENIVSNLNDSLRLINSAIANLNKLGFKENILNELRDILTDETKFVDYRLKLYNETILQLNKEIALNNKQKDVNEKILLSNRESLNKAYKLMTANLEIKLNFKKFLYLFEKLKISNPPVILNEKGKYVFATFYEIPDDIKSEVLDKILTTINRGHSLDDIRGYINGEKALNKSASNLGTELEKYISSNAFKSNKLFLEKKDDGLNIFDIKTFTNLADVIEKRQLIDLNKESLGVRSVAYLDMLFELSDNILVIDQPEDNIDNDYISRKLVPNIKSAKKIKQLIFVTHNPSVAVYGDAFNYIYAVNDGKNNITYKNYYIEDKDDKEKLLNILEGGRTSFSNRDKKFGNILGEENYGVK